MPHDGRVDAVHDKGALLLHRADKADLVLPVDLGTGTAGIPSRPTRAGWPPVLTIF